jgi:hypothetical protein
MQEFATLAAVTFGQRARVVHVPVPVVAVLAKAARLLPVSLYPDQLDRLRAPKPPLSPDAELDLAFRARPLTDGLKEAVAQE